MNQTANYQLNQWEASDRIRREDFNRDNVNIESGMTALQDAVVQEAQAREAADAAASAAMNARVDAIPFVKLFEISTENETQQMDLDLSAYPLEQYFRLIIIPEITTVSTASSAHVCVRCNGISEKVYRQGSDSLSYWAEVPVGRSRGGCVLQLLEGGGIMHLWCTQSTLLSNGYQESGMSGCSMKDDGPAPADLKTLNFVAPDTDTIQPGSKIAVFGLKR